MGWKVAFITVLAAWSLPLPATAASACAGPPLGFDAWADGDTLHLLWNLPAECPGTDGAFKLYRNGTLVTQTSDTTYDDALALPAIYSVQWQGSDSENSSMPSNLVLLGTGTKLPHYHPNIDTRQVDDFIEYLSVVVPCPPVNVNLNHDLPFVFDIVMECVTPFSNFRVKFI